MLTKRIIPCLDIKNGRTVKGVNFLELRDAGDPVELAAKYAQTGADELVFLDISATEERRRTLIDLVRKVGAAVNIPFTVGGRNLIGGGCRFITPRMTSSYIKNDALLRLILGSILCCDYRNAKSFTGFLEA